MGSGLSVEVWPEGEDQLMAVEANVVTLPGLKASTNLGSNQYWFVKMAGTAGQVKLVSATTDDAIGPLQNDPAAGQEAEVAVSGFARVAAGTSVGWNNGVWVGWNTTGLAVPLAANGTNDNRRVGGKFYKMGDQASSVAIGQIISIQLFGGAVRL